MKHQMESGSTKKELSAASTPVGVRYLVGEEQKRLMDKFLDEAVRPHAQSIAEINVDGDVAVIVHKPLASTVEALRILGWDGSAPVFRMSAEGRELMADNCAQMGDHLTGTWLRSGREGRLFIFWGDGTLLMNFEPEQGFFVEPGSLSNSWMN